MKRGRDNKLMEPMFPRLHVNDAFKGGPRAPPRNKMALYEQLSMPSQRFHSPILSKPNGPATNFSPQSSQVPSRNHHYENQYCLSSDSGASLAQLEQRKKPVEDDYTVPIFISSTSSQAFEKISSVDSERELTSNPHHFSTSEEDENKNRQLSNGSAVGCVDGTHNSSPIFNNECLGTQLGSLTTSCRSNMDNVAALGRRNSSNAEKDFTPRNQNFIHDVSSNMASLEDGSCKSFQAENLERDDSISETSDLETGDSMESITPDDVVSLIGQKRFWKARRTIANQQRIFAIQVFELHKLIKVQKFVAASPHLLLEEATALLSKPAKSLHAAKKLPLDSNISKQKELPSNSKEATVENAMEKPLHSASENGGPPLKCGISHEAATISSSSNNCGGPVYLNQLQGHQLLIPVMSPSEGLVYKPYPGACFPGQACRGCGLPGSNQTMNNFVAPPPLAPYGYFSTYGMPILSNEAFSSSTKDQMFPSYAPAGHSQAVQETRQMEDTRVLASTASSPGEKARSSRAVEVRSILPFFPAAVKASAKLDCRPIKVVPHNSVSASESAARIFRSIQEERLQHDSA